MEKEVPRILSFTVEVESRGPNKMFYGRFRKAIMDAVESFPFLKFRSIHANWNPDPFTLKDPDKPPRNFE